jgi:hypothetical protein
MRQRATAAGTFGIAATLIVNLASLAPATAMPTAAPNSSIIPTYVTAGRYHTLAVLGDGTMQAWGENSYGQLGDVTHTTRTTPVWVCAPGRTNCATDPTARLTNVATISAGWRHSVVVSKNNTVQAWEAIAPANSAMAPLLTVRLQCRYSA